MNPDFTKIPYGFAEFPKATLDAWNAAAGPTTPWTAPEGFQHRAVHTASRWPLRDDVRAEAVDHSPVRGLLDG